MSKITYTFPANCDLKELAGKTVTGGTISKRMINGAAIDVVLFETKINGKQVIAKIAGKPELEAALAEKQAADAKKIAAQKAFDESLEGQREKLRIAEYNSYSPDHFPGSAGWRKNQQALKALEAFDAAHPEIVAAIKAEQAKKEQARFDALSDFVKAGG